jgi:hypothetical protein
MAKTDTEKPSNTLKGRLSSEGLSRSSPAGPTLPLAMKLGGSTALGPSDFIPKQNKPHGQRPESGYPMRHKQSRSFPE